MNRSISLEAYRRHIDSGKQLTQWQQILKILRQNQMTWTRAELEKHAGMRISSVCGRVKELLDAGLIEEHDRRKCSVTGEPAHPVSVKNWRQGILI